MDFLMAVQVRWHEQALSRSLRKRKLLRRKH